MRYFLSLIVIYMLLNEANAIVHYSVSFPKAKQHYAEISIEIDKSTSHTVRFSMPVWTPGSYKIREFSQNVDETWYETNGEKHKPLRIDKNTWECRVKKGQALKFTYNLYAFELGVRTSYIDQYMAFLHGPSAFMYAVGYEQQEIAIHFNPLEGWNNIEMPLDRKENPKTYSCANYDLLADSPVALGNFDISTYTTAGVSHKIVMIGEGNYNLDKVTTDFKKITDVEAEMFENQHPSPQYIHFIQNVDNGGGGLEHLNCHTSQVNRWAYQNEEAYLKFLGLVSHEYFHLWNVKRIRPIELGPFDYNKENYTDLLWVAEGITSYFDDLFLKRAGFYTDEKYLAQVAYNINRLENLPGKDVMTLSESSKLAWVKAYLTNENSNNVTISYYNKGMLVAWMLDVTILGHTNGEKRLDDVMRSLYKSYYLNKNRGFTYKEFVAECSAVCGRPLGDFFNQYVNSTKSISYPQYLDAAGYTLENAADDGPSLSINTKDDMGKCLITYVRPLGPGSIAGLSVNDEIIAINGWRVGGTINTNVSGYESGKEIEITYNRDGKIHNTTATLKKNTEVNYSIKSMDDVTEDQEKFRQRWLN